MSDLPLSRTLPVSAVPADGLDFEVVPTEQERRALAAFNEDVISIERFVARLRVTPAGREGLRVEGSVEADATRACTATLDPFTETVSERIDVRFEPGASEDDLRDGAPEPLHDGEVDLGALAAEFFTLGLDPYPRKPGAVFEAPSYGASDSPFAVLKNLANGPGGRDS